ncbi:cyanoexosortase A system-associated protein [Nostoc sp. MS1]|uniref:cyanoexosortase A system-associated protein n=1 Tax=Nostoc sp. MS1 TaxID=2764711 RepID=UPI001CC673CE|nr:cyanoexosortase A system-associated protein [Nostoc sp. MS1]BCL35184.1 hypothetical protein NSMS1_16310 [Nostoc sp. MS1]
MYWKEIRFKFLASILGLGILVTAKSILFPNPDKPKISNFVFPQEVPLAQWQPTLVNSIEHSSIDNPDLIAQKHYRYVRNSIPLDIEMRYLGNFYEADIGMYLERNFGIKSFKIIRQKNGVGFYALGIDKQKAYLSSCINPRGNSTFTHAQFRDNRFSKDISFHRIIPILIGKEALLDKRCLWVYLSIPVQGSSHEEAYQVLEKAWFSWYQWWQPRFPEP